MGSYQIIDALDSAKVKSTVKNIKSSLDQLVHNVSEGKTSFITECENLNDYDEETFDKKREGLVSALNLYEFGDTFSEEEIGKFTYASFH